MAQSKRKILWMWTPDLPHTFQVLYNSATEECDRDARQIPVNIFCIISLWYIYIYVLRLGSLDEE